MPVHICWIAELNRIQASTSARGQFGGSDTLFMGMRAFRACLNAQVGQALEEIGHAVPTRGRQWHDLHDTLEELVAKEFTDIPEVVARKMYRGSGGAALVQSDFETYILKATGDIRRHQAEWTAPRRERFQDRHWLLAKVLEWAVIGALGSAATLTYQWLSDDHDQSPGTQSSPVEASSGQSSALEEPAAPAPETAPPPVETPTPAPAG